MVRPHEWPPRHHGSFSTCFFFKYYYLIIIYIPYFIIFLLLIYLLFIGHWLGWGRWIVSRDGQANLTLHMRRIIKDTKQRVPYSPLISQSQWGPLSCKMRRQGIDNGYSLEIYPSISPMNYFFCKRKPRRFNSSRNFQIYSKNILESSTYILICYIHLAGGT